jgi:hypothetical protein
MAEGTDGLLSTEGNIEKYSVFQYLQDSKNKFILNIYYSNIDYMCKSWKETVFDWQRNSQMFPSQESLCSTNTEDSYELSFMCTIYINIYYI